MEDMEENEEGPGDNVVITSIPTASTFFGRGFPRADEEEDEDCEEEEEEEEEEEGRDEEEEDDEDEDEEEEYDGRLEDGDTLVDVGNGEYLPARALHAMLRMIYDRRTGGSSSRVYDIQMNPTGDYELETVEHISNKVSELSTSDLATMLQRMCSTPVSRTLGASSSPHSMLQGRETRARGRSGLSESQRRSLLCRMVPSTRAESVDQFDCRVYGGRFSKDGSMYVASTQGKQIIVYDPRNNFSCRSKVIEARHIRWTITDTDVSPDQRFVVYSTTSSCASLTNLQGEYELHESMEMSSGYSFGIFCLRYGAGGQEVVAGCNDQYLRVYDIERKTVISETNAHDDDINAVSFADNSYRSDVIFSGGDDNLIKAWDRRMMTGQGGGGARPQGILIGHTEGITHITAKGDGRYLISNGKDQCCKLWDIRKMTSPSDLASKHPIRQLFNWDYRMMDYPTRDYHLHPSDDSVMTYRGHQVLETLIRCYFSPEETTGQRYIYTGSADGVVHVYDVLTGEVVSTMAHRNEAVRDVSWHPTEPTMCTVSWDGCITKWTYDESQPEGMPWWREGMPLQGCESECR